MNFAIALGNKMSSSLNERLRCIDKEEIRAQDLFGFREFLLRFFEIEIDVQGFDEVGYRVVVLVVLLLDDADDILQLLLVLSRIARARTIRDNRSCQISQDPGASSLNRIDEWCREEQFADRVARFWVVEKREKSPVNKPSSVGELCEGVVEEFGVDGFLDFLDFFHGDFPVCREDLRGKFSPCCGRDFVVVGGEDAELVEQVAGGLVVTAAVLEVAEIVEDVDHFDRDLFHH